MPRTRQIGTIGKTTRKLIQKISPTCPDVAANAVRGVAGSSLTAITAPTTNNRSRAHQSATNTATRPMDISGNTLRLLQAQEAREPTRTHPSDHAVKSSRRRLSSNNSLGRQPIVAERVAVHDHRVWNGQRREQNVS